MVLCLGEAKWWIRIGPSVHPGCGSETPPLHTHSKIEQTPRIASRYENCPVANVNHYALCYAEQNEERSRQ